MILYAFIPALLSVWLLHWCYTLFQSKRYIKLLVAQGGDNSQPKKTMDQIIENISEDMQRNPDMQVLVQETPKGINLVFIDTSLIKDVLTNHRLYNKQANASGLTQMFSKNGLVTAEGEIWKLHRKVISSAFQYDFFNDMIPTIAETADDVLDITSPKKKVINLPADIELITAESVTRVFFGFKSSNVLIDGYKASDLIDEVSRVAVTFHKSKLLLFGVKFLNLFPSYRKQKERIREFRSIFGEKIQERMRQLQKETENTSDTSSEGNQRRRDLLQAFLENRMTNGHDITKTFSDDDILDEFVTFFRAGKSTTALLISMTLYCCVKYPEWGNKLKKEIDETTKDWKSINLDMVNSMNILSAFVNEVLRVYPPAPDTLTREANIDHYVGKFFVKKGTLVDILFMANSYNPKFFNNPDEFDPARFLNASEANEKWREDPYAYLPFSAGQRGCIAKHLALLEAKVIISLIIKYYDIHINPDYKLKMGLRVSGYAPVEPIPLELTPK